VGWGRLKVRRCLRVSRRSESLTAEDAEVAEEYAKAPDFLRDDKRVGDRSTAQASLRLACFAREDMFFSEREIRMIELESMAVEMPVVEGHPNRAGFRGVLTVVDVASQRAPSGSKGHRVVLTRKAAEAALPSLLGMALDYAPSYDRHDVRRKVGVITSADIVGRNLEVGGYLYAKDFPDVVEEIGRSGRRAVENDTKVNMGHPVEYSSGSRMRSELAAAVERLRELTAGVRGRKISSLRAGVDMDAGTASGLGMSFEVSNVILVDKRAPVWILTHVTFTGAAILRRNRAAYEDTWIGLA
jgi:hypothetical protein